MVEIYCFNFVCVMMWVFTGHIKIFLNFVSGVPLFTSISLKRQNNKLFGIFPQKLLNLIYFFLKMIHSNFLSMGHFQFFSWSNPHIEKSNASSQLLVKIPFLAFTASPIMMQLSCIRGWVVRPWDGNQGNRATILQVFHPTDIYEGIVKGFTVVPVRWTLRDV